MFVAALLNLLDVALDGFWAGIEMLEIEIKYLDTILIADGNFAIVKINSFPSVDWQTGALQSSRPVWRAIPCALL